MGGIMTTRSTAQLVCMLICLISCSNKDANAQAVKIIGMTLTEEGKAFNLSSCSPACVYIGTKCASPADALSVVGKSVAIMCPDHPIIYTKLDRGVCDDGNGPSVLVAPLSRAPGSSKAACIVTTAALPARAVLTSYEDYKATRSVGKKLARRAAVTITKKQMLKWTYGGFLDESNPDGITDDAKTLSIMQRGLSKAKSRILQFKGRPGERLLELKFKTFGYQSPPHGSGTQIVVVALTDSAGSVTKLLTGGFADSSRILGVYDFDGDGLDDVFIDGWGADGNKGWNGDYYVYLSRTRKLVSLYHFWSAA